MENKAQVMSHEAALNVYASRIEEFQKLLDEIAKKREIEALLKIIRKPGWTTPAELFLCQNMLDSLRTQVLQLDHNIAALVKGADMVGHKA